MIIAIFGKIKRVFAINFCLRIKKIIYIIRTGFGFAWNRTQTLEEIKNSVRFTIAQSEKVNYISLGVAGLEIQHDTQV